MAKKRLAMDIEPSLADFVKAGKQLKYDERKAEPGMVGICGFGELKAEMIDVCRPSGFGDGYFKVPAVSLTNECEDYAPEYILLWLPNEKLYGAWNCDDGYLTVFPDAKWEDIVGNPLPYINAQWESDTKIGKPFDPATNYKPET